MQPQLCSRCKKNVAVVFITRMENGKNINEGLCLKCAKNLGLPQVNEMMQRMGITDEDLDNISNEMMSAFGGAENLEGIDAPDGDDEEDGKTATFPFLGRLFGGQNGDAPAPAEVAAFTLLKEQLMEVLDTLTPREEKVLRLRFGLDDGKARTLEEVGKEFNVTRERIRQIEAKALRKLRHPSRSKKLKDFLE